MKRPLTYLSFIAIAWIMNSCTKTESDFTQVDPESITINVDVISVVEGGLVNFTVTSSIGNAIVTGASTIYVNGTLISGSKFIFAGEGTYAVHAIKGALNSNVLTIKVTAKTNSATSFISRVLVEEYSGTWCGNCPAILYGVDLLHKQTDKTIVVGIHLFNGDPFITSHGNSLAANLGVTGVPAGNINRTKGWNGPQYENVAQITNQIKPLATLGLAINSTVAGNTLDATVIISYGQALEGNAKLTVYLVEDKLFYTQRNYSSTLYAGQASISNFEYNGVLRSIVSDLSGDVISNTGAAVKKNYSIALPSNITNIANTRLVAFVTNDAGTVMNVQDAKIGTAKDLETL